MAWLYWRSRGVATSAALVVVCCLAYVLLAEWANMDGFRQAAIVQAIPALVAAVIGIGAWSPFGEPERTMAMPLGRLRTLHIGSLTAFAGILTHRQLEGWEPVGPDVDLSLVAVRNLAGLTGAALVLGRLLDARLSWLAPFTIAMTAAAWLMVAPPGRVWSPPWWVWTGQGPDVTGGWLVGGALALAGLVVFTRYGSRDASGDEA